MPGLHVDDAPMRFSLPVLTQSLCRMRHAGARVVWPLPRLPGGY